MWEPPDNGPLFNLPPASVVTQEDQVRLSRQCQQILTRLQAGPATNAQLSEISLKYTGRISDLRAAGYTIECKRGEGGLNVYRLVQAK